MNRLVAVKPDEGERFGDFVHRLIVRYPKWSNQFRVSPGHTDGVGRSSVALLVPQEVADDLASSQPVADDLIGDDEPTPSLVDVVVDPVIEADINVVDTSAKSLPVPRSGRRRTKSATS
jgi:hypothetical protein